MIKPTQDRPEIFNCFQGESYAWFELHDDDGLYGYMALRKRGKYADIHVELTRWTHTVLKHMKTIARLELKDMCRTNKVERLIARKEGHDTVWPKFIKHFGFCEPERIQMSYMEI